MYFMAGPVFSDSFVRSRSPHSFTSERSKRKEAFKSGCILSQTLLPPAPQKTFPIPAGNRNMASAPVHNQLRKQPDHNK